MTSKHQIFLPFLQAKTLFCFEQFFHLRYCASYSKGKINYILEQASVLHISFKVRESVKKASISVGLSKFP